jgi:bifunctional non-homologous end joining protein LigD
MTRPQQLPLSIPPDGGDRLPERIRPMQASSVDAPFDDPDYLFEPWWPGVRAIAFVESGRLRLQVEGLSDALAAVPEVEELVERLMEDGVVLDGTLLVLDAEGHPDPALLRARLGGEGRSGRPAFVASDLLWSGGEELTRRPYRVRRARLAAVLRDGDRVVVGRGYRRDGTLVAEALASLGIDGLSARLLEARYRPGPAGDVWLRAPIVAAETNRRPTLALIQRLPLPE